MKILLDTHAWLWWLSGSPRIDAALLDMLNAEDNDVFLSAASAWEMTIKYQIGKLSLPAPPIDYIPSRLRAQRIRMLPISQEHACYTGTLPLHHNDPFDRILVAQTLMEKMQLVTGDKAMLAYGAPVILIA